MQILVVWRESGTAAPARLIQEPSKRGMERPAPRPHAGDGQVPPSIPASPTAVIISMDRLR
ncbi:hypothetical protein HMPREF9946_02642 [Acetobacteraceae bacterium AT-5844]|nr:hypothetical protein HMPREF9946_02642 [Acetobacteraceae bacterium AT-5844]